MNLELVVPWSMEPTKRPPGQSWSICWLSSVLSLMASRRFPGRGENNDDDDDRIPSLTVTVRQRSIEEGGMSGPEAVPAEF